MELSRVGESKCSHVSLPGVTLSRKKEDPIPRVTLPPGWLYYTRRKCEMCNINARRQGEVKLMQSWLTQGSFGGRVTLLLETTFMHVNT